MADEPITSGGWLPPAAPGGQPPPRFDAPRWQPPEPPQPARAEPAPAAQPARPAFVPAAAGTTPRNRAAVWALVLGITGLTLLLLSFGTFFVVTLPCSIAAWVLGVRAQRRIESGETTQGAGQATAALWLGRIGVVAGVAALVVFVVLIATDFDFEKLRDDLQRQLDQRRQQRQSNGVRSSLDGVRATICAWLGR